MKTIRTILILIVSLSVLSCGSKRKTAYRYFNENNKELAQLCLDRFPIKTDYIKGDTITITDTLKVIDVMPVIIHCPDGTEVECPPRETKYIDRIKFITDTFVKIDTRKETILNETIRERDEKISKLDNKLDKKKKHEKGYWGIIAVLVGILMLRKLF